MKNLNSNKPSITIKSLTFTLAFICFLNFIAKSQTTVFSDDFNRTNFRTGGTPQITYDSICTAVATATPNGFAIVANNTNLNLSGVKSSGTATPGYPTAVVNGRGMISGPLSSYLAPFNPTLNANTGLISWSFNIRTSRSTSLTGFSSGGTAGAVVLACNMANFYDTGANGYAVYFNKGTTNNAISFGPFTGGISTASSVNTFTEILKSNDIAFTNYVSVFVTYLPSSGSWTLYVKDDGTTATADASTINTNANIVGSGSLSDNTHTALAMTNFGFFMNYLGNSSSYIRFDNFKVTSAGTAPIKLISFDAVAKQKSVTLSWATASEKDNALFKVEQSTNGLDFKIIGEVTGAGTKETVSNYAFEDQNPATGTSYYRLKQVDFNGTATFSDIKAVKFTNKEFALAYNLVQNNLQVSLNSAAETSLAIYNMAGQQMIKTKAIGQANLDVSALKPGVYVISAGNGTSANFIKQ